MSRKLSPLAALAMVALIGVGCSNEPAENGNAGNTNAGQETLVSERIAELREEKEALEGALAEIGAEREEAEAEELSEQLARVPDLTKSLREASPEVQRQVFQAFELQILYDKAERRIEISATVSEAIANAFENKKALPKEGSLVVLRDIAGARYVSRYHRTRVRELVKLPA